MIPFPIQVNDVTKELDDELRTEKQNSSVNNKLKLPNEEETDFDNKHSDDYLSWRTQMLHQ
jgi:hypothetical protein